MAESRRATDAGAKPRLRERTQIGAQVVGRGSAMVRRRRAELGREVGKVAGIGGQRVLGAPALGRKHVEEQLDQGLVGVFGLRGHSAASVRAALRTCPAESKP